MVGCLFLGLVLSLLGLAVLLIPLGTALSFGQGAVVTALLGAAAWTAWAAWRDGGPLALVLDVDGTEQCFPALPEDAAGCVALELEGDGDGVRVYRAPPTAPGLGGVTFAEFCKWLAAEHKVAAVPLSAFFCADSAGRPTSLVRFAVCKEAETVELAAKALRGATLDGARAARARQGSSE